MTAPRILCAGLVAVDVSYFIDAHPVEGNKHRARAAKMAAGGGALNAAAAVVALGGHAMLAGPIGDDHFADVLRAEIVRLGIDDSLLVTVPDAATSHSAILINDAGERTIINHRDARLFQAPTPRDPSFDALLIDTRWRAALAGLLPAARSANKPAVVDAEAPLADVAELLNLASHVAFSEQGLADLSGDPGPSGLAAAARRLQTWVCVTRGARSVLYHDGQRLFERPVQPVAVQNTLGAGDVWHGAFTLGLAERLPTENAILKANAAASEWVQRL